MSVRVTAPHGRSARRSSPSGCSPPRAAVTTAGAAPARPLPEAQERPLPEVPTTAASTETPTPGGKLVYGIEADTGSPWRPSKMVCAISGHRHPRVYDPLTIVTDDGTVEPYLAERVTPNADYTVWTIKARPGITFHDGTPLDGAAIVDNLNRRQNGFLTGKVLTDVHQHRRHPAIVVTDPLAVEVTMKRRGCRFPIYLAGAIGYIARPRG